MRIIENFDLTEYNSYRIKSVCQRAVFPENEDDIVHYFSENKLKKKHIIGSGHNLILSKSYYEDDFIIFSENYSKIFVNENIIEADAGAMMSTVSEIALQHCLTGVEVFYDIPSSVGGAIVMNAGTGDEEIKNILLKVKYFNISDQCIYEIENEKIKFNYRKSLFQDEENCVILKSWFDLISCDKETIKNKMLKIKQKRHLKQPREYPSAGSVFKRPQGYYVGSLIEELGLKGFSIGGAQVSEKHAGFIINKKNASGQNIIDLINEIQKRVLDKYNISLTLEQRII